MKSAYFFVTYAASLLLCPNVLGLDFPSDFKFGVATASYQVEGGWNASGKGENIWDRLTHENPKRIEDHGNGDIACDSYHLWKEDVEILKSLGVNYYRFSISWTRILPSGFPNRINPDGIRYYNDLINELINNNIEPMVTLYHWDLPQPLQDLGGWPNSILVRLFEEYAKIVFEAFGDRVKTWITFNEPIEFCSCYAGRGCAPAIHSLGIGDYLCGRSVLLAHARVYHLYNRMFRSKQKGKVGITVDTAWSEPKTNSPEDIAAAERSLQMNYGWWVHPILSKYGDYPEIMKTRINTFSKYENFTSSRLPRFTRREIWYIQGTYDFLGLNHYSTHLVSDAERPITDPPSHAKDVGVRYEQASNWESSTLVGLKIVPWGFRKLLNWIKNEFDNPLVYVTENGFADKGELNDTKRIQYYQGYLNALLEAIHLDGCNVAAYTAWSVIDNMEWLWGYTVKFGLYQVDFSDPKRTRTAKASAAFYRNVIKTRTVPNSTLDTPEVILV